MNTHPDVDSYFLEMGPYSGVVGDTYYTRGSEALNEIITKTVAALKYFSGSGYDYVIRTNLSSVWSFPRLIQFLHTLPRTGVYCGEINRNVPGLEYVSGAGMILSPDVCKALVETPRYTKIIDDVDIGCVMYGLGILPTPYKRQNIGNPDMWQGVIPSDVFNVRIRFGENRELEIGISNDVVAQFYPVPTPPIRKLTIVHPNIITRLRNLPR